MRKLLRYQLLIVATLLLTAQRLPAPITVPPEATPRPPLMPGTEPESPKKAEKQATKEKRATPRPVPHSKSDSLAGVWKGFARWTCPGHSSNDGGPGTVRVSEDEKTIQLEGPGVNNAGIGIHELKKTGTSLSWKASYPGGQKAPDGTLIVIIYDCKLKLQANGSAALDYAEIIYWNGVLHGQPCVTHVPLSR